MKHNKLKVYAFALILSVLIPIAFKGFDIRFNVGAVTLSEVVFPQLNVNGGSPIKGVDISSIIAIEKAGVVFRDTNGVPQDIFLTLKQNGINYIRARVWNDPKDASGKTYGGGNNDAVVAAEIGKRAAQYGMKLLVDFHYSDFWADPGKQNPPKAWKSFTLLQKENAIYSFTLDTLKTINDAGADIGMVQVGNETNYSMCGLSGMNNLAAMMKAGSRAVREFDESILIAVHFTDPQNTSTITWYASELNRLSLDYDVFMTSYYSFWHGTIANLKSVLSGISSSYGKYVMVAEMSHPYTNTGGDGFGHAVTASSSGVTMRYSVSEQGQVDMMKDVYSVLAEITATGGKGGGIGAFYWEPAWLGVMGLNSQQRISLWESYGSGWATKWAGEFDDEARQYGTGGSSYQNQALFAYNGRPLDSLSFFKYVRSVNEPIWTDPVITTPPVTTTTPPVTTTTPPVTTTTPPVTTTTPPVMPPPPLHPNIIFFNDTIKPICTRGLYFQQGDYNWQLPAFIIRSGGELIFAVNDKSIPNIVKRMVINFDVDKNEPFNTLDAAGKEYISQEQ